MAAVDQAVKAWAAVNLAPVGSMPLIPGVIELRFYLNDGAAFSILEGRQTFLVAFTSIALVAVAWYLLFKKPASRLEYAGWLLVLGGGVGNLIDRVQNGAVVDYFNLLFMDFAIFNLADVLVCTGIGLLVLAFLLELRAERRKKQTQAAAQSDDGTV